jgi:hypothetical protein
MSEGISVGDAVLSFLGDTTQLDATFDRVGAEATAKMGVATTAVQGTTVAVSELSGEMAVGQQGAVKLGTVMNLAGKESKESMYQARGEAGLLGEAFGVHLPRHVRSFVAELPGVGTALSAAFSATAVLFIIEAIVKLTEKASDLAGAWLFQTEAAKKLLTEMGLANLEIAKQNDLYHKAKEALDTFGETAVEKTAAKIQDLKDNLAEHNKELARLQNYYGQGIRNTTLLDNLAIQQATVKALQEEIALNETIKKQQENDAALKSLQAEITLRKSLTDSTLNLQQAKAKELLAGEENTQSKLITIDATYTEKRYQLELRTLRQMLDAEEKYGHDNEAKVNQIRAKIQEAENQHAVIAITGFTNLMNRLKEIRDGALDAQSSSKTVADTLGLTDAQQKLDKATEAAHNFGIVLHGDLVTALHEARDAKFAFVQGMGTTDKAALDQFDKAIQNAQFNLDNFGKAEMTFFGKQSPLWKAYEADVRHAGDQTKFFGEVGKETFGSFAQAAGSAFDAFLKGQASFGQAMKQAAAQTIDALAAQAFAQALYWSAMGLADLYFNPARSAEDFAAAETFGAVAALAGAAGFGLGSGGKGGSGSSASPLTATGGANNTQQPGQGAVSVVGVQHFAMGGLISAPTLSMIGEGHKSEAVLPLDDPKAMARIGKAIADASGGGGVTHNWHIEGLISPDNLQKVARQISEGVQKNRITLKSSSTFRINKRSA